MNSEKVFDCIGSNLQKAREKKGLTLSSLSKKCGIAESNLCGYESGNSMSVKTLIKIVNALEVTFDSILSDTKVIYFEKGKANLTESNIANAIEYLFDNKIIKRKRVPEDYPRDMDVYSNSGAFAYIDPLTLENTRLSSDSSIYNSVIIDYPYSIPVLRYVSQLEKNINYVKEDDEKELIFKMQKKILVDELQSIKFDK